MALDAAVRQSRRKSIRKMDSTARAWVRTSRTPEGGCQGENGGIGLRLIEMMSA